MTDEAKEIAAVWMGRRVVSKQSISPGRFGTVVRVTYGGALIVRFDDGHEHPHTTYDVEAI